MRPKHLAQLIVIAVSSVAGAASNAQTPPTPILHYMGHEHYSAPGGTFIRYRFEVTNRAAFPAAMFAPAPNLPPCGANANSSRTWVDFFSQDGRRLYGFCALGNPAGLGSLWFALPPGESPPDWVYVELVDRQANQRFRSNLERPH